MSGALAIGGAMAAVLAAAAAAVVGAVVVRARRGLVAITVEGFSMTPAFLPGERVLVARGPGRAEAVRRGQVVVVERPSPETGWTRLPPLGRDVDGHDWYIKRVAAVAGDPVPDVVIQSRGLAADAVVGPGELVLLGDHVRSEDSKHWGCVPVHRVLGVVLRKL